MNKLVQRAINILRTPRTEWPVIAAEPATPGSIYVPYVLLLSAIAPLALLIGGGGYGMFRFSSGLLFRMAITQYVAGLIGVALFAAVIHLLATTFGATKDYTQALKSVAYAATASWVAGIGQLLGPGLGGLLAIAGAIYSIYLLYLSLPHTMKAPPEKAAAYTAVSILVCILLGAVLMYFARSVGGFGYQTAGPAFDPDSPLGRLEQAGRAAEQAQRDGKSDAAAGAAAASAALSALAGGKGAAEALPPDTLKTFLPETLGGLARRSVEAQRNSAVGLQVSTAEANYGDAERQLELEVVDTGGAAGFMAFAGWAQIEGSKEEGTRTERTGREGGRIVHEEWDSADHDGEYIVILGNRFVVKVEGKAGSLAELKSALGEVDLARLESLKNEGVPASSK